MSGTTDKLKGKLKQAAGDLTGNKDMHREGKVDEAAGKTHDAVDNTIDAVKDKLTKNR